MCLQRRNVCSFPGTSCTRFHSALVTLLPSELCKILLLLLCADASDPVLTGLLLAVEEDRGPAFFLPPRLLAPKPLPHNLLAAPAAALSSGQAPRHGTTGGAGPPAALTHPSSHTQPRMEPASGSVLVSTQAGQVPSTAPAAPFKPPNAPIPGLARPNPDDQPQLTQSTALAAGPSKINSCIAAQSVQPSNMHQALSNPNHMQEPQHAVHPEAQQLADLETDALFVLRPPSDTTWIQSYAGGDMATLGQGNLRQPSAPDYLLHAPDASCQRDSMRLLPPALAHLNPHNRQWVPTLLPVNPFRIAQLAHCSASERHAQHMPDTSAATLAGLHQSNKRHALDNNPGAAASKKRRLASGSASAATSVPDVHARHRLHEQYPAQLITHNQGPEYPHDGALLQDHGLQAPCGISESNPGSWQQSENFPQQPQGSWQQPQFSNTQRHFQNPAPNLPHQQPSSTDASRSHLAYAEGLGQHPGHSDGRQASPGGDLHQQHVVGQQQYGNGQHTNGNGQHTNGNGQHTNGNGQHTNDNGQHTNGNGQHANGDGQHANCNGQHINGNGQHGHDSGQYANLNGQDADANWQQSGHDQLEQHQHAGRSMAMPQQQSASRSRLHSELMHFSALASSTEVRHCHLLHSPLCESAASLCWTRVTSHTCFGTLGNTRPCSFAQSATDTEGLNTLCTCWLPHNKPTVAMSIARPILIAAFAGNLNRQLHPDAHQPSLQLCNPLVLKLWWCKQAEQQAVSDAVEAVTSVAKALWPQSRTVLFGSQATTLALPGSDLDIVILGVSENITNAASGFTKCVCISMYAHTWAQFV